MKTSKKSLLAFISEIEAKMNESVSAHVKHLTCIEFFNADGDLIAFAKGKKLITVS